MGNRVAFNLAKLANMSHEDCHVYELSLKYYRDFINVIDTAKRDGIELGIEIGIDEGKQNKALEIAKTMLAEGFDIKTIVKITGLTEEIILQ